MNNLIIDIKQLTNNQLTDICKKVTAELQNRKANTTLTFDQQQAQKKHNCDCGGAYTHANIQRHNKTKKHQKYILENTTINDIL